MDFTTDFATQFWNIMLDLSPSLLLGMFIAGLMHEFLPSGIIHKHLSAANAKSVFKSVLLGVPMPLCSCGVVPTAIGLKNEGASKGAATGFLISTPQTGVDSVLVSATFLGWPFALFKVLAAFITGIIGGLIVNATTKKDAPIIPVLMQQSQNSNIQKSGKSLIGVIKYALFDLLASIDLWLLVGIIVSALIATLVPVGALTEIEWTQGIWGMLVVLLISLPLYICTTASVPIAATLIASGMPLGTALVFLMAGPATNAATIGAVFRGLGKRVLFVYLAVVATMSITLGLLFDFILDTGTQQTARHVHEHTSLISIISAILLSALLIFFIGRRIMSKFEINKDSDDEKISDLVLNVSGMSCGHCTSTVKKTLEAFSEVEEANPDLASGKVLIKGQNFNLEAMKEAIVKAGFQVS